LFKRFARQFYRYHLLDSCKDGLNKKVVAHLMKGVMPIATSPVAPNDQEQEDDENRKMPELITKRFEHSPRGVDTERGNKSGRSNN
jgi:hypothetical protein